MAVAGEVMGYRERSLWVSLGAVALVDTLYFFMVLRGWWVGAPLTASGLIGLLLAIAGLLIVIEMGFVLGNARQREPMDERDEAIAARAARFAYGVFALGVLLALLLHLVNQRSLDTGTEQVFSWPLFEVHLILGSLVSAELTRFAVALLGYRR